MQLADRHEMQLADIHEMRLFLQPSDNNVGVVHGEISCLLLVSI